MKETLCRLKKEIDVGLGKIELAIKTVELGELGQGVRAHSATLEIGRKGKEKVGEGGLGPRVVRGFKATKEVFFWKPKSGLGLSVGQARGPRSAECLPFQLQESRLHWGGASSSAGLEACDVGRPSSSEEAGKSSGEGGLTCRRAEVKSGGVGSSLQAGFSSTTLLGTSEVVDTH